jgi:hypothetical protein
MILELENLIKQYGEQKVKVMVKCWQSDPLVQPLTCADHNIPLKYHYGKLYCPEKNCWQHQHWIPDEVVKHWETKKKGET